MNLRRIDHIGVVVDDLDEAKHFLSNVLGLELVRELALADRPDRSAFFRCGEVNIEVIEVDDHELRLQRLGGSAARIEHIAIEVDDLEETMAAAVKAGIEASDPIVLAGAASVWTVPETTDGVIFQFTQLDGQG